MTLHPNGNIIGTKANVGKNSLASIARSIASWLGLPLNEAKEFLGHCWRRTALTWCANAGLSLVQLKNVSGHHSDSVVQGYIDNSTIMREIGANAVAVSGTTTPVRFNAAPPSISPALTSMSSIEAKSSASDYSSEDNSSK